MQINQEVRRVFDLPDIKAKLQAMDFTAVLTSPEEYDEILRADIATYTKVARTVGLIAQ